MQRIIGPNDKYVLILFSGGVDSTACINYYKDQNFSIETIFIDYGQKSSNYEKKSAVNIASYFGVPINCLVFKSNKTFSQGEIEGRNAFLVLAALLSYPDINGSIAMGIHSGTPYYDCSDSFVKDINQILNGYTNGKVILSAPFLKWDKKQVYNYCRDNKLPIHLTYSCESGTARPCGKCLSCLDRGALLVS